MLRPRGVVIDQELSSTAAPLAAANVSALATEAQIIAECRAGNTAAWDSLLDKYYATVARFVFQLSGDFNHEDTEEICQETFLSVVRNLSSFRVEAHFKRGCCGSRRTGRWIIGKKREPRNEAGTRCTSQSMRLEPMTSRRLIHHLEILVPMRYCKLPRHPAS
jgi:hypothetical protein